MFRRKDDGKNRQVSAEEAAHERRRFLEHIHEKTVEARAGLGTLLANSNITNLGCVDKKIDRSQAEIPGGGLLLYFEDYLEEWFANRKGKSGEFLVHLYCGYLYVERGLESVNQHSGAIARFQYKVRKFNKEYGCNFTVRVATDGSAKPFMGAK